MSDLMPTLLDVSNKGQILIPSSFRKALGIKPKGRVILYPLVKDKKLIIESLNKDPIEAACGMFASSDKKSWSRELIKERVKDLKREEK